MRDVLSLIAVALPFAITPGASFTLTLVHATGSRTPGWRRIALGTTAGILLLALAMGATGLGAVFAAIPVVRIALGLVGGVVLIAIGITVLVKSTQSEADSADRATPAKLVRWSFATVITNPKALSLYVIIVPTLTTPHLTGISLFASFAAIHTGLLTGWLCLTHHAVTRMSGLAHSTQLRRGLLIAAGVAMIALGILTAARTLTGQ